MHFKSLVGLVLGLLAGLVDASAEEELCQPVVFENARYTVCQVDVRRMDLALYSAAPDGTPFGSFSSLMEFLGQHGRKLVFAMNAGMYDRDLRPIGLYVENGVRTKRANTRDGPGNFHLKPNGVFYIDGGKTGVLETVAYLKSGLMPQFATQSGPMLVIDGRIHPKFGATSASYKRRNGVGVTDEHTAVFAISDDPVTFYDFARLFRDEIGARNALFFDGTISSLYYQGRSDGLFPLGPMVAVTAPQ
jgi:uncharacterized protein YigE (DUF2233 family)